MITDDPNLSNEALRLENERLRLALQEATTRNESLSVALKDASSQNETLRTERLDLLEGLRQRDLEIDDLQQRIQVLLRRYMGQSSEKMDPRQRLLFEDFLDRTLPEMPAGEKQTPSRKGHGRRKLPADLEREKVVHDLDEEDKPCPCCGTMRHLIGKETHEQLEYVPAKLRVLEHVRLKYGCPQCERQASPDGPQIVVADKPSQPIEKGLAGPGLLSYVIVSKYTDHLPLHRLEAILSRHGIRISRSTMCDWMAQCADVLAPLVDRMRDYVLHSTVIHTDDTPVTVQDRPSGRHTGRFWVYLGDEAHPYTVFAYTPSRSRDGPMTFLAGWGKTQKAFLQADAFGGYDGIYRGESGGSVTEVACWVHARRKVYDARGGHPEISQQALEQIRQLYALEKAAKQEAGESHDALVAWRYVKRQEAIPRLKTFRTWLISQMAEQGGDVLPKSPMGKAIQYVLNQWDALCVYTTDGRLAIDNNTSENALRRVAVGRKNWLFAGSDNGGRSAAVLYSLMATCQRHRVDPFAWCKDTLSRIPDTPLSQLDELLPDHWKENQNEK